MAARNVRKIARVWRSIPTVEGAGVRLKRAFGFREVGELDPFLLLDDFGSDDPDDYLAGFPWHPHRGIETITYMLHGRVEHGDSMGNKGVIGPGDVQWMTAGNGIIHQEMPKKVGKGLLGGFQLWANLPAKSKMMDPRYRDITAAQIPEVALDDGVRVKIICGEAGGVRGPVKDIVTDPAYLDVSVPAQAEFVRRVPAGHTVFAYVFEGGACFDEGRDPYGFEAVGASYMDLSRECSLGPGTVVLYGREGGLVKVTTAADPVRFLLVSGGPIGEPVAWYGPIVMNTQEELRTAFEEYRDGTFIKGETVVPGARKPR